SITGPFQEETLLVTTVSAGETASRGKPFAEQALLRIGSLAGSNPIRTEQAVSVAIGSKPAMPRPARFGSGASGPLPSAATMASTRHMNFRWGVEHRTPALSA